MNKSSKKQSYGDLRDNFQVSLGQASVQRGLGSHQVNGSNSAFTSLQELAIDNERKPLSKGGPESSCMAAVICMGSCRCNSHGEQLCH